MKAIIILILLSISVISKAQDSHCNELLQFEKDYAKKVPVKLDSVTTLVDVSVNCTTNTVEYEKHLSVSSDQLPDGLREKMQRQQVDTSCRKKGLGTQGWTTIHNFYDNNNKLAMKLELTPGMCNER